ncbi:dihydroneopterin aldolase [Aromatoleum sp.]|uniref:dihydroneopterin aldolase n=1 Tax=Aromatoleum sp. TaxID=2307007 RepID=UPI002FC89E48
MLPERSDVIRRTFGTDYMSPTEARAMPPGEYSLALPLPPGLFLALDFRGRRFGRIEQCSDNPTQELATLNAPHPMQRLPACPAPSTATDAQPAMDIIFIDGFRGSTIIGICEDELHAPQPVRIDLAAGLQRSAACSTDRIGDTIDYGEVRAALREMLRTHRFQLLEAFAEAIADLLLTRFGAHWLRVSVTKPAKFDDVEGVGVIIERRRPEPPQPAAKPAEVLHLLATGLIPQGRRDY